MGIYVYEHPKYSQSDAWKYGSDVLKVCTGKIPIIFVDPHNFFETLLWIKHFRKNFKNNFNQQLVQIKA